MIAGKHGNGASTNRSKRMSLVYYIENNSNLERQNTIDNRIVLDPDVIWMKAWSIWIRLLLILSIFASSFRIGIHQSHAHFRFIILPIADVCCLIDIVMFFRKVFYWTVFCCLSVLKLWVSETLTGFLRWRTNQSDGSWYYLQAILGKALPIWLHCCDPFCNNYYSANFHLCIHHPYRLRLLRDS